MIGDRELLALRSEYCALLSRLFLAEPDPELMGLLAKDARGRARSAAEMNPAVSEGWFQLSDLCARGGPAEWAGRCGEEYVELFVGPGIPKLTPCESHYRSGRAYGVHLAHVRRFMERVGIEPAEDATEPEDHVSFEFQILRHLIEKQAPSANPDEEAEWLALQGEFLRRHLGAWAPRFFQDLVEEKGIFFYEAFAKIGMGYIAWENELLEGWGPRGGEGELLQIQTDRPWKGPLFDPPVPHPERVEDPPAEEE